MSKRYFLVNKTTNSDEQKVAIIGQVFLKLDGLEAQISENGGPVVIFVQDEVVTVRVEAQVEELFFNSHPLKKGGLYFLETGDKLNFKNSEIEIISTDVPSDELPSLQMEKSKVRPKQDKTSEEIVFKVQNKHEITRTSIDINELLAKAKSNKSNQKKYANKSRKTNQKVNPSSQLTKGRAKKPQPIALPKHRRNFQSDLMIGPFVRLFAFIAQVLLTISLEPLLRDFGISKVTLELSNFLTLMPQEIITKISYLISIQVLLPYLVTYIVLEIIGALIFSTTLPLFLIGVTTDGEFFTKRIKALFRVLISFITTPIIIFDLPLLAGKMTAKEYLTRGCISYRSKILKFLSLINLVVLIFLGIFYQPVISLIKTQNFTYQMIEKSSFDEVQAKTKGIFKTSKEINESFKTIGVSHPKLEYLLVHEQTSNFIQFSEYANINYKDLDKIKNKIAFFSLFYPDLNKFLEGEDVDSINLKKDVVNLFSSGEILLTNDFFSIFDLNIFSMNTVYSFLKDRNLRPSAIKIINDYNRIYKMEDEQTFVTFTNHDIKFLAVTSSYEDVELRIEQIAISNLEQFQNPIDQAITGESNLLSLEDYSKNIESIKNIMVESKFMQSMSTYNSFINTIIKNIPPEKEYIIEYLSSKKL